MKVSNFHLTWEISEDLVDLMHGKAGILSNFHRMPSLETEKRGLVL